MSYSGGMKTVLVGALTLLLGIFLGGLAPRAELRRTRQELAAAKEAAASGGAGLLPALGLGGLAAARERAQADARRRVPRFTPQPEKAAPDPVEPQPAGARAGEAEREKAGTDGERRRGRLFGGDGEGFAAAKAAADLRAAQFRAAFIDEARLSPERQTALDSTMKSMNDEFAKAAAEIAETMASKGKAVSPRDMADVGVRLLDIYRRADDAMKAGLDDTARAALERTRFDALTQIDLQSFQKLAETMENADIVTPGRQP
jgi:hypothetical protein